MIVSPNEMAIGDRISNRQVWLVFMPMRAVLFWLLFGLGFALEMGCPISRANPSRQIYAKGKLEHQWRFSQKSESVRFAVYDFLGDEARTRRASSEAGVIDGNASVAVRIIRAVGPVTVHLVSIEIALSTRGVVWRKSILRRIDVILEVCIA